MSIAIMTRVWSNSPRQGVELLIELALADFADDAGRSWPAVETIAKKARCSDRYVQLTMAKMVKDGSLVVDVNAGPYGTNLYTLISQGVNSIHPRQNDGVNSETGGGELQFTGGVNPTSPGGVNCSSPDPSLEPSREPLLEPSPARGSIATGSREGTVRSINVGDGAANAPPARRGSGSEVSKIVRRRQRHNGARV